MTTRIPHALALFATLALVSGCGGGDGRKETAKVVGTLEFDGKPVKGGSLTFSPTSESGSGNTGKPGVAKVGEDGTFSVSTYSDGDGAVVGKHTVSYTAPTPEPTADTQGAGGGHEASKPSEYAGLVPKEPEVTVLESGNTLEIELVKPEK